MKPQDDAELPFKVEMWSRDGQHITYAIAKCSNGIVAVDAFKSAVKRYPDERITLRHGTRLMREHPERWES